MVYYYYLSYFTICAFIGFAHLYALSAFIPTIYRTSQYAHLYRQSIVLYNKRIYIGNLSYFYNMRIYTDNLSYFTISAFIPTIYRTLQ